jgi:uncharacterized protein
MKFSVGILIIFIVVFGFFLYLWRVDFDKRKTVEIFDDHNQLVGRFNCEIADTAEKRAKGLMFRKDLPENQGMLFIFSGEKKCSFWMMNTYIPLDIIFADKDYKVIGIIENAKPKSVKPLSVDKPSKYVVEINAGLVKKYGIKLGDEFKVKS